MVSDSGCFDFEADFVTSLRCIPLVVRLKLDLCGVKLKLSHWQQFSLAQRQTLLDLPCTDSGQISAYRFRLQQLVIGHTGQGVPELPPSTVSWAWQDTSLIPPQIQAQLAAAGVELSVSQWSTLTPLQRFALDKLSRPGHENRNFIPALREFGLIPPR